MHILITGAFGFVGYNLSKAIKTLTDHQLVAVDISEPENHTYNEYYSWNDSKEMQTLWWCFFVINHYFKFIT